MSIMFEETYLLSPGPVNIPERVLQAMQIRSMHHRSAEFSALLARLLSNMQAIFRTAQPILPVHATGRGAVEATITNLLSPGDEVVSVCNGRFGEMYADIAAAYGVTAHRVCTDWEKDADLAAVDAALAAHPAAKALTLVHSESATALANDVEALAKVAHAHGRMVFVDAVSSLGGMPFEFDAWGVDAAVTASQKALMGPTGLSFAALSDRAWEAVEASTLPKYYTKFASIRKNVCRERPETPGSTPVALVAALLESTSMILEEGTDVVYARHRRLSQGIKAALVALGFPLFPDVCAARSDTLSAAWMPDGLKAAQINKPMQEMFGVVGKSGLLQYKDNVLRIGHMGHFRQKDALICVSALEFAARRLGITRRIGAGMEALLGTIEERP
ncbi:alanine--glyoxylate aminotransferase family protein [Oleispirillum naphthae]|uniref:pyridoxal-phosphate-dependent aminotransferase family protein n=1 Tax=Oleispirillum naphthae TaxID=2838853 RepID=UPI0030825C7D